MIYLIVKNADSCTLLLLENNKIHIFSFQFNVSYPRIIEIFARPCFIINLLIALLSLQHIKFEISNEILAITINTSVWYNNVDIKLFIKTRLDQYALVCLKTITL